MNILHKNINVVGIKFYIEKSGLEIARAYLYILYNDIHKKPFGLIEDVFVNDDFRNQGLGSELIKKIIEEAKSRGCYKLICTSRYSKPKVHDLYKSLGFVEHGKEFRINF
jgi:GNAT superfamily N-acetyltransferase